MLAKEPDRLHDLLMRNLVHLHHAQNQINPHVFIDLELAGTGVRVTDDDHVVIIEIVERISFLRPRLGNADAGRRDDKHYAYTTPGHNRLQTENAYPVVNPQKRLPDGADTTGPRLVQHITQALDNGELPELEGVLLAVRLLAPERRTETVAITNFA